MFELYRLKADEVNNKYLQNNNESMSIEIFEPSIFKLNISGHKQSPKQILMILYWFLISKGKYKIYYVRDGNLVIHTSYCISKCYKFPFMKNNDIHIGPCETSSAYRGRGIYPNVLLRIICDNQNSDFYMIIDDKNISSQKGVSKVGFKKIQNLKYNTILKTYEITKNQ